MKDFDVVDVASHVLTEVVIRSPMAEVLLLIPSTSIFPYQSCNIKGEQWRTRADIRETAESVGGSRLSLHDTQSNAKRDGNMQKKKRSIQTIIEEC
jgi:hypothetical protein